MNNETKPIELIQCYFNELEQLRKKALAARQSLVDQYNYDIIHDYRITIFEQIDRIIIYHDTNVLLFLRYIIYPQYVSDLFNTSERDSKRIAIDYLQRTKHALIIFIQSVIESYYRALCSALAIRTPTPFAKVFESLFTHFKIPTDNEWYLANDILAKVRNTLHNNGRHTHKDNTVDFHGKRYVFSEGELHHAGGYDTIIYIISDLIEFLKYIGSASSNIQFVDNHGCVDYNV